MSLEQSIQNLADAINAFRPEARELAVAITAQLSRESRAVEHLASAIDDMSKESKSYSVSLPVGHAEGASVEPTTEKAKAEPKVEKTKPAAAEKPVEKTPEPAKAEEPAKALEGEVLPPEKTEAEIREEAFGAPDGYIYKPFIALGQGGKNVAAQKAICAQFGVARISLVPVDQIPAMKAAVEAALAEVQGVGHASV